MYPMFAGVPSSTPSAASRSATPADSAGRSTASTPSTIATPSRTASSTACRAGDGVWWTTSSRGTRAPGSAGPAPGAGPQQAGDSGPAGPRTRGQVGLLDHLVQPQPGHDV